jgi:hypothetical protein
MISNAPCLLVLILFGLMSGGKEALVIICENSDMAEKILDTAEKYRSNSHGFTTLQELMEAIVVYE